jgi:UDP-3-O-[3-hydroxymyristoyl] glucosamine N-acyltransferase
MSEHGKENNPIKTQTEAHAHLRALHKPKRIVHSAAIIENEYVDLGKDVSIGAYSHIGREGFAFDPESGFRQRLPHMGKVVIGDDVEIGSNTCIDRGILSDTIIGKETKIDNLVQVGHNAVIGSNCLIVAGTVIGASSVLGSNVFVGMNVSIKDQIRIGSNVVIGAGAIVIDDIPSDVVVYGNPGRVVRQIKSGKDPLPLGLRPHAK